MRNTSIDNIILRSTNIVYLSLISGASFSKYVDAPVLFLWSPLYACVITVNVPGQRVLEYQGIKLSYHEVGRPGDVVVILEVSTTVGFGGGDTRRRVDCVSRRKYTA